MPPWLQTRGEMGNMWHAAGPPGAFCLQHLRPFSGFPVNSTLRWCAAMAGALLLTPTKAVAPMTAQE